MDTQKLFARYTSLSPKERLHIAGRLRACPWQKMTGHIPKGRHLVDIGCGHGLFLNLLELTGSRHEKLTGFDPDERKIAVALRSASGRLSFVSGSADQWPDGADTYTLMDVLYLVPFAVQEELISAIHTKLPVGGHLVIKELDTRPLAKFVFAYCEELVMVRLLKATLGTKFYFRSSAQFKELAERSGFRAEVIDLQRGYLHPHVMLVCRKEE
jgi:2-polyprenyl-3-methyl-5-hydroxy-6-metoxy-1,4-benzoquinol methylase